MKLLLRRLHVKRLGCATAVLRSVTSCKPPEPNGAGFKLEGSMMCLSDW